ncbi:MAG TPA: hypothetical protein VFI13_00745, partial [Gemmatimonadales bacterium]|nr:hypothetical protein [Gemmatimonadales bacterium]
MTDRRSFLAASLLATAGLGRVPRLARLARHQGRPRPTAAQLAWQRDEFALFVHFGMNTFTDREWGDGTEDPRRFAPTALDCRQWARTANHAG